MGCHFLLQGIFLTQGLNPGLQHCRQMLYRLSQQGGLTINYMHMISTLELCVYQLFVFDKSLLFNIIWEIFSMACLFIYQIYLLKNKSH